MAATFLSGNAWCRNPNIVVSINCGEKSSHFLQLRITVAEVPADDDAGLTAAYDTVGVELQLETS